MLFYERCKGIFIFVLVQREKFDFQSNWTSVVWHSTVGHKCRQHNVIVFYIVMWIVLRRVAGVHCVHYIEQKNCTARFGTWAIWEIPDKKLNQVAPATQAGLYRRGPLEYAYSMPHTVQTWPLKTKGKSPAWRVTFQLTHWNWKALERLLRICKDSLTGTGKH